MSKALKNNNNLILASTILIILVASFSFNIKDLTGKTIYETCEFTTGEEDTYNIPVGVRVGIIGSDNKYCDSPNNFIVQKSDGTTCTNNYECKSNVCVSNFCSAGSPLKDAYCFARERMRIEDLISEQDSLCKECGDGVCNPEETIADCPADCTATCTDGVQNQGETMIDCGGANCPACIVAPTCTDTDDGSKVFVQGTCTASNFPDGIDESCKDSSILKEAICYDSPTQGPICLISEYSCPNGCDTTTGACFEEQVHPTCGDGTQEAPEECDDGNLIDWDGCSALCIIE